MPLPRLSFKVEGEVESFPDKQKLKEFMTTKPALQQILRGTHRVEKGRNKTKKTKSNKD